MLLPEPGERAEEQPISAVARTMRTSNLAAVVCPVQQSLALSRPTCWVARIAVALDLCDVPPDGLPSFNLPRVFLRNPPPHVVAAVPLKPASRIVRMDPAFATPQRERLAGINTEVV